MGGWGGEQRRSERWIQEQVASALSLEDIISTRGGRALEAKTWRLSAPDPLIENSGLQELTDGNQGCGWARPEHRSVAGRAVLAVTALISLTTWSGN